MLSDVSIPQLAGASVLVYAFYRLLRIGRREPHLPPGPPTLPILGNLHVFPTKQMFLKFSEWSDVYGDIVSLKLGGGTVVVLNTVKAVRDILETQSFTTSNRPPSVAAEAVTDGLHFATINPTAEWRSFRRAAKEILSPAACAKHKFIQAAEVTQLTYDILSTPNDFFAHCERYTSSVILSIVSGKRAPRHSTPFVAEFFRMLHDWTSLLESGAVLDFFPWLKYLPPWRGEIKRIREWQGKLYMSLLEDCEAREANGMANGCQLEVVQSNAKEWGFSRDMLGWMAGVIAEAGSGTTAIVIQTLILLLMTHPDVQRRAQEEIDAVIGKDRAPSHDDIPSLPYLRALINEVNRFRPVDPLAFPHAASSDVAYKAYRLPAGTLIFPNLWNIFHDPEIFDSPDKFEPERYLSHPLGLGAAKRKEFEEMDENAKVESALRLLGPSGLIWGVGRRTCPGMHLAQASFTLSAANLLWAFSFSKPRDAHGREIEPNLMNFRPGVINAPYPYACNIRARSPRHANIIRRDYHDMAPAFEPFEQELTEADRRWVEASRASQPTSLVV